MRTDAPAPAQPRRVSGPAGGRAAAAAEPRPRQRTQPRPQAPRFPRRISGPARSVRAPLAPRLLAALRALPDHPLLDRLIRGRTWIALLGLMLAGIVAMQVEVLKLGASMGRAIERTSYLQGRNESLRESVASLADDQRIERLAAGRGMVMPAPAGVSFLNAGRGDAVARAIASIRQPAPDSFLSRLAATTTSDTGSSGTTSSGSTSSGTTSSDTTGSGATTSGTASPGTSSSGAASGSSDSGATSTSSSGATSSTSAGATSASAATTAGAASAATSGGSSAP